MQCVLFIHSNEAAEQAMSQEKTGQILAAFGANTEALKKDGALLGSNRLLQPVAAATTVRVRDGKTTVLNGPYAETREQLGGYYLIDVPDLAAAQAWAARCPSAAFGTIEVRPVWAM